MDVKNRVRLRRAVRFLYDLQKLRISTGNRKSTKDVELEADDLQFMTQSSDRLLLLEKVAEKEVKDLLKGIPIWEKWLKLQKGVGTRIGGVVLAEFDINVADTVSSMWRFAGLGVVNGKAEGLVKGQKCSYNPWLKSKMTKILGDSFIKSNSPWRKFYDDYKHRKQTTVVPVCAACDGKGVISKEPCSNCNGTGGPAPWGKSDKHRHQAAIRYMCKMFLQELWVQWRTMEGLDVREPYAVEYLKKVHNG